MRAVDTYKEEMIPAKPRQKERPALTIVMVSAGLFQWAYPGRTFLMDKYCNFVKRVI